MGNASHLLKGPFLSESRPLRWQRLCSQAQIPLWFPTPSLPGASRSPLPVVPHVTPSQLIPLPLQSLLFWPVLSRLSYSLAIRPGEVA